MIRMRTRLTLSLAVLVLAAPVARANHNLDVLLEDSQHNPWSGIRVEIRLATGQAWHLDTESDGFAHFQSIPVPTNGERFNIILDPDPDMLGCAGYAFPVAISEMGGDYILLFERPGNPGAMLCHGDKMVGLCGREGGSLSATFATNHYYLPTVVPCD